MKKKNRQRRKLKAELSRIVAYSITGGAWFWSGYAMFAVCDQVLGLNLWWAKLIANVFGISVNFILERTWVFQAKRSHKRLTVVTERYITLTLINFVLDYAIIRLLRDQFGISPYIGQFASAGFFYMWNYVWYKYWVFSVTRRARKV